MKFAELKATTKLTWKSASNRRPGTETTDKAPAVKIEAQDDIPGVINNQPAGSSYEWNVARALWKLGWQFSYQIPVSGGRQVRGGQVLDFLVKTVPLKTAVIVNGDYWHQTDEDYSMNELMAALIREGVQVNINPVVMWQEHAATYEAAYGFLYSKLGKG
jgi:hypothetical protein